MVDHIDRISNLPSNVIDGILQHLPLRDLARTSILSRKWRYMWLSVPRLHFPLDFFQRYYLEEPKSHSVVTQILLHHNGPVSRFTLEIPYDYLNSLTYLTEWILILSKSGIKYLELLKYGSRYEVPSHLFSCQGLTYLKLDQFELSPPPNFCGFKSMLELHLIDIGFKSGELQRLISGCPVLNMLTIKYCSGFDSIHVSAPSLKVLCIQVNEDIKSICLKKANNLTDLTLVMTSHGKYQVNVSDFIKGLPKIERLYLGSPGYPGLSGESRLPLHPGIIMQTLQKSINSLKCLELDGVDFHQSREILFIASLLKSSSILVELVIKEPKHTSRGYYVAETPLPDHLRALYCSRCCLSQLRKVNITVKKFYEHALDLIRFLLANSSSLEVLTFKVGLGLDQSHTPTLLSISQDLLQMRRASQRAEVKFLYDALSPDTDSD